MVKRLSPREDPVSRWDNNTVARENTAHGDRCFLRKRWFAPFRVLVGRQSSTGKSLYPVFERGADVVTPNEQTSV